MITKRYYTNNYIVRVKQNIYNAHGLVSEGFINVHVYTNNQYV